MASGGLPEDGGSDLLGVYLQQAECLIAKCRELQQIKGIHKLEKNCKAELKYLLTLKKKSGSIHESQLKSSNLCHFAGILHALQVIPHVTRVMKKFNIHHRKDSLNVDVVAGQGLTWVKVIARKAQSLHLIWAGQGQFGERDLVKQAEDYIACSKQHPVNYVTPKVNFAFYNQVTKPMADALEERGVKVWGQRVDVSPDIEVKVQSIQAMFVDSEDSSSEDYLSEDDYSSEENEVEGQSSPDEDLTSFTNLNIGKEKLKRDVKEVVDCITSFSSDIKVSSKSYSETSENLTDEQQKNKCERCENIDFVKENQINPSVYDCDKEASSITSDASSLKNKKIKCSTDHSSSSERIEDVSIRMSERFSLLAGSEQLENVLRNDEQLSKTTQQSSRLPSIVNQPSEAHHSATANHSTIAKQPFISCLLTFLPKFEIQEMLGRSHVSVDRSVSCERGRVNLDITTLITLVSSISHGGCQFVFQERILTLQAAEERESPVLPSLQAFIQGKDLFVCQTALDDFNTILNTLGGTAEKQRSEELLKRVTVVPDQPSDRARDMPETGKIRTRSKIVFGTGDYLKAVTTSANVGFVRAAEHQGVYFAVHLHPSRALTEQKEKSATRIDNSCVK